MIDGLNPRSDKYEQGCRVMHALNAMKQAQRKEKHQKKPEHTTKSEDGQEIAAAEEEGCSSDEEGADNALYEANKGLIPSLLGENTKLIKYKKAMRYEEFLNDPFGKKKTAAKEEARLVSINARKQQWQAKAENDLSRQGEAKKPPKPTSPDGDSDTYSRN